jgi:periplasmic divalent cation tolerance protein
MTAVRIVLCTAPAAAAKGLADALLGERLVACVNCIGPVTSRYVWQGAIEEASEMLLLMKTTVARLPALRQRILALHGYQVPEIVELPVEGGHAPYLQWVLDTCARPS